MKSLFPRPVDDAPEPQQTTRVSYILILASLGTYLIVGLIGAYFHDWKLVVTMSVASVALAGPFWLLRSGYFRAGHLLLMVIVLATITAVATVGQGIRDLALVAYPVVFIYVGLTFDRTILRLCGGLTFIALLWLALGESLGWFAPVPLFPDPFNLFYLSTLTVLLVITALAVDLLSSNIRRGLQQARNEIEERKKAEDSLRQSHLLLNQMGIVAHVGGWVVDRRGMKMEWTEEMYNIHEVDTAFQPTILNGLEFYEPASRAVLARAIEQGRESGEPFDLELEIVTAKGNHRWVRAIGQADKLRGKGYGTLQDITDRMRTEEALRESNELFSQFLLHSPIYAYIKEVTSTESRVVQASENFKDMVGLPGSQMTGKTMDELFPLEFATKMTSDDMAVVTGGKVLTLDEDLNGRNYTTIKFPISRHGRNYLAGYTLEITERKKAERELAERESRLRALFDNAAYSISVAKNGIQITGNPSFVKLYGYQNASALIGVPVLETIAPEERNRIAKYIADRAMGLEVPSQYETRGLRKDGSTFDVEVTVSTYSDNGEIYTVGFQRDISERKQAEEERTRLESQLQQAQKMESVGRLAGGVAHDFNNMLGVIIGHAELALEQVDPGQPLHEDLEEIHKAATRSADLTRQLLAFARKQTVVPRVLGLNETVQGMLTMLERLIGEDVHLVWEPQADLWPVKMDPAQIDQILANLCVNARDAIADVGTISIRTLNSVFDEAYCTDRPGFMPGEYVSLAVSDDGCGMDEKILSHLFEPFFTTKGVGKGTGLGLATVYGAVKQNNGMITVVSEPGGGTTFTIYLPRHTVEPDRAWTESATGPLKGGRETILLVEDEGANLLLTTMMLQGQGYTVLASGTPGEALRMAREYPGPIHMLLTDVVMPEMNGRDLASALLSILPRLKRLFTSGYTADVIASHGVLDEGVHFIEKPFSVRILAAKVREVLDGE